MTSDDRGENSTTDALVGLGVGGAVAFLLWKAVEWWKRDEDGPTSGWGVGFGTGNGWVNLNPFDKGKAGTGDGGDLDGNKWERYRIAGVKGWRRKGIPLPKEPGGPATYQAAVLIVGNGKAIPDLSKWPKTISVFFVHDVTQPLSGLFSVDGGWGTDARFGESSKEMTINAITNERRYFNCAAKTSDELTECIKNELENSIATQWI